MILSTVPVRAVQPKKAQIEKLIDENGDEVRLKKGAHVEVAVTARAEQ
jgi:hypothetical protein